VQGAVKDRRRYRYYVSKALVRGTSKDGQRGWRVPAPELERAVALAARTILDDNPAIFEALKAAGIEDADINRLFTSVVEWKARLTSEFDRPKILAELVERVTLSDEGIRVGLKVPVPWGISNATVVQKTITLFRFVPLKIKRRGVETRLIINGGDQPRKPDPALLKALARARLWFDELASGCVSSLAEIARREGLPKRYVTRLTKLAFVAPVFVDAVADGSSPIAINLQAIMDGRFAIPSDWSRAESLEPVIARRTGVRPSASRTSSLARDTSKITIGIES
jgi:site-specific DNA recombinase